MKHLLKSFNPKQVFRHKKRSTPFSISAPTSFNSGSYSSTSSDDSLSSSHGAATKPGRSATLPARSRSGDWSDGDAAEIFWFDYVTAFKMIDRDGDGKITLVELESLLRHVGGKSPPPTAAEVAAMIGEIDLDGDGCISLEELQTVGSVFESTVAGEEELLEAFDFFDADHNGKISAEELHAVFAALGDDRCTLEDCRRMIKGVDKNGDGFVCFEDFTRMMDQR